ncbi:olfactory receptor 1038-like [Protobothrops mucrosquamatus]|uniref:olfactory receptor 1038-like n=1 Tax=Protobothrops mucrosquamatus TaxID=103944 RepID=UPI000775901E|nr:olfactory receptor 1038-like [Protobothrops mucrosquamatus]
MAGENNSIVTEFFLIGLTENPNLVPVCFVIFLLMYLITCVGNLGMISLIQIDSRLHTPMYYFLNNLAFVDFCYSSTITPRTLTNFLTSKKSISFAGCIAQLFSFVLTASVECLLLAVMAYDRYVAICNPLLYTIIMTKKVCTQLVGVTYIMAFIHALAQTISIFRLSFCHSNVINHYFCDIPPLLKLSCNRTFINEIVLYTFGTFQGIFTSVQIFISYIYIVATILRIRSSEGRHKAFSTCISHLTAVLLFYGTTVFIYVRPISSYSLGRDKIISVFYTMVIPMLNPLIYSLRNREVKDALKRILSRIMLP